MPYNFAAESFHTKKLCNRLSLRKAKFLIRKTKNRFWGSLWGLGATYAVHLIVDFLLVIIELFSLGAFVLSQYTRLRDGWTDRISTATAVSGIKVDFFRRKSARKFLCVKTFSDKVVRHSLAYLTVHKWLVGDVPFYLKFCTKVAHPFKNGKYYISAMLFHFEATTCQRRLVSKIEP